MSTNHEKQSIDKDVAETHPTDNGRRNFFRASAAAMGAATLLNLVPEAVRNNAWAAGKDTPEITEVKIGFIPLTDCAPIIVAAEMGFDKKYGIKITPSKEASWAAIRDKTVNGELHAAHVLYGLIYGVQMGIGGQQKEMSVLMTLNNNGQGITLASQLKDKGVNSGPTLKRLLDNENRDFTFAQTFPTGTHAMWLNYWLAANGINPVKDVKTIVVPPRKWWPICVLAIWMAIAWVNHGMHERFMTKWVSLLLPVRISGLIIRKRYWVRQQTLLQKILIHPEP